MRFRFTYSATGRPTYTATGNPSGWDKAEIGFERDPKLLSLIEFFKASFALYGNNGTIDGARQWFLNTESANGADSLITQLIEIDDNDDETWVMFFTSVIAINTIIESYNTSHLVDYTLSQQDFWSMFIKRFSTPIDVKSVVTLDGDAVAAAPSFTLPLPCQTIHKTFLKQTTGDPTSSFADFFAGGVITLYLKFDLNDLTLDEIDTRQNYNTQISTIEPVGALKYDWKVKEKGTYTFFTRPLFKITVGHDVNGSVEWWLTTGRPGAYTNQQIGVTYNYVGKGLTSPIEELNPDLNLILANYVVNLEVGDEIYIYGILNMIMTGGGENMVYIPGDAAHLTTAPYVATLQIRADTVTPDTSCDALLTHDIARNIVQKITGQDLFISNYLGNAHTSIPYGAQGCGSMLANMLGLHIRGYSLADKPLQMSMQDWWDGINPMHCLGLGYEKIGGVDKIVCETADYFFDDSNVSVQFINVADIRRSYDSEWQFNQLKFGYDKWESQAKSGIGSPSGIDDPQSQRSWSTRFQIIGKSLQQFSKWILASLTIETARRLGVSLSSNYTYDNDVCAIALHDNGGSAFVPETNQDFSAITNLLNSPTRYNSSHTPARLLLRWSKYWSGCLQDYLASFANFASGVGNFLMTSTKTSACVGDETGDIVAENGNFAIDTDYLFLPTPLEINHYIDWPTYKYMREHKNWSIEISQTEADYVKCFIKSFRYNKAEGKCSMVVWPKTKFMIQQIESVAAGGEQIPGFKYFQIPEFAGEFE